MENIKNFDPRQENEKAHLESEIASEELLLPSDIKLTFFKVKSPEGHVSICNDRSYPNAKDLEEGQPMPNWNPGYVYEGKIEGSEKLNLLKDFLSIERVLPLFQVKTKGGRTEKIAAWSTDQTIEEWDANFSVQDDDYATSAEKLLGEFHDYGEDHDSFIGSKPRRPSGVDVESFLTREL